MLHLVHNQEKNLGDFFTKRIQNNEQKRQNCVIVQTFYEIFGYFENQLKCYF